MIDYSKFYPTRILSCMINDHSFHTGQPPKHIQKVDNLQSSPDPAVLSRPSPVKEFLGNPKSKLNEFCQSKKFSSPKYQTSEGGFVVTVSIMIEGQEVHYSYTSEQAMSTKKYIKQCEEMVAEKAFTALNKLYGTCMSGTSPQSTASCDDQSGNYSKQLS